MDDAQLLREDALRSWTLLEAHRFVERTLWVQSDRLDDSETCDRWLSRLILVSHVEMAERGGHEAMVFR